MASIQNRRLNVGCGRNILTDWVNMDRVSMPGVDVIADLDQCGQKPLPLADDSFHEFLLSHVLEHIHSPLPLMQELHRIAVPGALAHIRVPYGSSDNAWEDPTHIRPFFLGSFGYYSQPYYWRADYGYRGDWQTEKIILKVHHKENKGLSPEQILERVYKERNVVQEMIGVLVAVKPIREPKQELQKPNSIEVQLLPEQSD